MSKEFEIARLAIVRATMANEIDISRGYAWSHRIYPLSSGQLEETFKTDFNVSEEQVSSLLRTIDDAARKKKPVSFYDLEGPFGSNDGGLSRMELYHVCRLAFLDRRFDADVWSALTKPGSGPIETQGMTKEFSMQSDIDY